MVLSYKQKFNLKYKQLKNKSNSLKEISDLSGYQLNGLLGIMKKGRGAFKTNPSSVRPNITSATAWAYGRVYSAVMGGKASKIDKDLLIKKK